MEGDREIESFIFSFTGKQEKMNITKKINNIFTIYVSFQSMGAWESIQIPREQKTIMKMHLIFKASLPILLHIIWSCTFQKVHTDRLISKTLHRH